MPAVQVSPCHRRWLSLDAERARLLDEWSGMLRRLECQPGWFDLSEEQQREAERLSGLTDVDILLRVIHRRLRRWLRVLPTTPCRDLEGVVANLRVAERLLAPEENLIVHGLIVRAVRDLGQIREAR